MPPDRPRQGTTPPACQGTTALARHGTVEVLTWPFLSELGVDAVVTARHGGASRGPYRSLNLGLHVGDNPASVAENRRRAAGALGASLDDLVLGAQIHGVHAALVTSQDMGRGARSVDDAIPDADALVTATSGPVLVTLVADCSPVLLVDPDARILSTVHAGWRGAAHGAVRATIRAMEELGAEAGRIVAAIGPTVSPAAYVVGAEVAAAARMAFGCDAESVLWAEGDRWRFDVAGANRLQLLAAGVPSEHVHTSPRITGDGRFFSDRAARPCGRFGLFARLR